jgi:hypothetical protein
MCRGMYVCVGAENFLPYLSISALPIYFCPYLSISALPIYFCPTYLFLPLPIYFCPTYLFLPLPIHFRPYVHLFSHFIYLKHQPHITLVPTLKSILRTPPPTNNILFPIAKSYITLCFVYLFNLNLPKLRFSYFLVTEGWRSHII